MRIRATAAMATVLLCAAISASARPADPSKGPVMYGPGTASCGKWLADRENVAMHQIELSWVLGWLSAMGAVGWSLHPNGRGLRHTDADAVAAWVDKYCRAYPLNNIGDAGIEPGCRVVQAQIGLGGKHPLHGRD
jgi:hypothetical protein